MTHQKNIDFLNELVGDMRIKRVTPPGVVKDEVPRIESKIKWLFGKPIRPKFIGD